MLQQTPVVRVLPVWHQWLERWPTPSALAAESSGEAVRAWGRLGYPRRALRLHAAAVEISNKHDDVVPAQFSTLLSLPGIGNYTAAAVAAFAYGQRETVVDTNIRRVLARLLIGKALPAPALTAVEMRLAENVLPEDAAASVRWNAAVMELGALVCTARKPDCERCPVASDCAWLAAGSPLPDYVPKGQPWAGTDRQVRGAVMAVLRSANAPVDLALFRNTVAVELDSAALAHHGSNVRVALTGLAKLNVSTEQLDRVVTSLCTDGLAKSSDQGLTLPH